MTGWMDRDPHQRVVVTGMGIVSTVGETVSAYGDALLAGRPGIMRWKHMQDPRFYSRIGGDLSDFDLLGHLDRVGRGYPTDLIARCRALFRATPLAGRLVAASAMQAYQDAGLAGWGFPEEMGHVLAGHNLNARYIVENALTFQEEPDYIEPLFGVLSLDTDVLSVTSELLELKGPSFTVGGACASGNLAILAGLDLLRSGRARVVLVTGGSIDLEPVALHGWALIDALSVRSFNDEPERASRPFDGRREGFVPSEGSGAVVLETLAGARARGAVIQAELLGASSMSDASRLTKPNQDGQVRAMRAALGDARVAPEQVDYINAHATSTPLGDAVEAAAIKAVFGDRAPRIPVNSTKSMIGHCLSAAGVVELIATVLQMQRGVLHPTINQEQPDPDIGLDVVPNRAREVAIAIGLSNSFGFGGLNSSVVVGRAL